MEVAAEIETDALPHIPFAVLFREGVADFVPNHVLDPGLNFLRISFSPKLPVLLYLSLLFLGHKLVETALELTPGRGWEEESPERVAAYAALLLKALAGPLQFSGLAGLERFASSYQV